MIYSSAYLDVKQGAVNVPGMPNRIVDLTDGVAMVVTDLHGDRDAFDRCLNHFSRLYWRGEAQRLIFLGDMIHSYSANHDCSVQMVLDLIALRREIGSGDVIVLLGNHEMPHIYSVALSKGDLEFTPPFEHALNDRRDIVLAFFESLPFYVRTAAGVMLSHAGPSLDAIPHAGLLRQFDHRAILHEADEALRQAPDLEGLYRHYSSLYGSPYGELARYYLGVRGPGDPRYPHLLRALLISNQSKKFKLLWDTLFTQNEHGISERAYVNGCQQFLAAFSEGAPAEQQVIVSGHIVTHGGHTVVNRYHLRVSSATHATPRESGEFLLLDCARPVNSALDLLSGLRPVFE